MHTLGLLIRKNDIDLFYFFNKSLHCKILNRLMLTITQFGSTVFSVLLPVSLFCFGNNNIRLLGLRIGSVLIISQIIVQFIKRLVNRQRPYKVLEYACAIKPPKCQYSFPSGHTCTAFSIALVLSGSINGFAVLFLSLAFLVGISRIYLGAHYPTDVFAGTIIAIIVFFATNSFISNIILQAL